LFGSVPEQIESKIASLNTMCTNVGREEVTSVRKCMLTQFDSDSCDMFYEMPQMNVVWHELSDYECTCPSSLFTNISFLRLY
jgi:hypothetical protein